ncbi:hypothetical protein BRADI_3g11208v3 [Brachypodium distachyon]|nr:hypothetical protein BRADI_3g11208v3 [Brachypodium distachyon]PNT66418.1 hypothetical protein BRADI_3g11208v3 [Brachypodium distachyon]PNT66419.1 hypothetical protein BRADI_3g11208v3 [Brachypodium distachyon]PNT66420.1 hypothetical protein BRADI_3g11208v3 [Brachypodium distachyon]PNT66422.1 hypothetical protein BRADI_3g11208v3 [Brachypodium distachyon]
MILPFFFSFIFIELSVYCVGAAGRANGRAGGICPGTKPMAQGTGRRADLPEEDRHARRRGRQRRTPARPPPGKQQPAVFLRREVFSGWRRRPPESPRKATREAKLGFLRFAKFSCMYLLILLLDNATKTD